METSCDETSVAVVKNGREILGLSIHSQIEEHAKFRGVVPEIASRSHLLKIQEVYLDALSQSKLDYRSLDYIAVTVKPGLVGSLMIGGQFAKTLSVVLGIPLICSDHVRSHLYAPVLEGFVPEFPFLGLMLSGGNSSIYYVESHSEMKCIADTSDDAIGEAFDKAASLMALSYPGGPAVEKKAREYHGKSKPLFGKLLKDLPSDKLQFSFSGIKTAVMRAVEKKENHEQICFDFQNTVFELVERNLIRAVEMKKIRTVVASGGVLANGNLRQRLDRLSNQLNIQIIYPDQKLLCTDNAAMVAASGFFDFMEGRSCSLSFKVSSKR